jgi:hypothetical protein
MITLNIVSKGKNLMALLLRQDPTDQLLGFIL